MEIKELDKCGISDDIIKYKLKEWIYFHKNNKIIDINNFETLCNINENIYENIDFNDNIYNICHSIFNGEYYNSLIHIILYNKELVGIAIIDTEYNKKQVHIDELLLDNNIDWYNIIYNFINCFNKDNYDTIHIAYNNYMKHHLIIEDIMNNFNALFLKNDYNNTDIYLIRLQSFNCKYTNKLALEIVIIEFGTSKNILLKHNTNICISFIDNKEQNWKIYSKYNSNINQQNYIHLCSEYKIILEHPLIINKTQIINTSYIELYIISNNIKYKINENHFDFKFKKIYYDEYNTLSYNIIESIKCYYYNCKCDYCTDQLKQIRMLRRTYNGIDELRMHVNNYYYGFNNANQKIYEFFKNNKNILKKISNFNYKKIIFTESKKKLDLLELNILDLSYIFDIIKINKNNILNNNYNYIYLIQKYDVNLKKDLYKFGKTNRHFNERIKEHGKEAKVLLILDVNNCNNVETNILKILRNDNKIIERKDIGNEYFYCENKEYLLKLILSNY